MVSEQAVYSKAKRYRHTLQRFPGIGLKPLIKRTGTQDGEVLLHDDDLWINDTFDYKQETIGKRFVVTSAQYGAAVNMKFLRALENYCDDMEAQLIVLPIRYGNQPDPLKPVLEPYACYNDFPLNDNIGLNMMPLRPTLVNPLSSLGRTGGIASQIFASPKVQLEPVATLDGHHPKMLMTTGAVTYPEYQPDKTGAVALRDHNFAAVVIEVESETIFHYRHLIADDKNSFYDVNGKKYTPRTVKKIKNPVGS